MQGVSTGLSLILPVFLKVLFGLESLIIEEDFLKFIIGPGFICGATGALCFGHQVTLPHAWCLKSGWISHLHTYLSVRIDP